MKKIFIVLLVCFSLVLSGCFGNENLNEYSYLGYDRDKGDVIDVDGVLYKNEPITEWGPLNYEDRTCIGTVKNYKFKGEYALYTFNEDIDHVFLKLSEKHSFETYSFYYYRDDVDLPEFDIKNIEFNGFGSMMFMDGEDFSHTTYDRELIDTYLANIMSADQSRSPDMAETGYYIYLLSTEYPGIRIVQFVDAYRGKFWVSFKSGAHMEVPQDMLEEIAGRQLPTASEIEARQAEEQEEE